MLLLELTEVAVSEIQKTIHTTLIVLELNSIEIDRRVNEASSRVLSHNPGYRYHRSPLSSALKTNTQQLKMIENAHIF